LLRLYLQERGRGGRPVRLVLDFDGTDDPAHGQQEGVAYHGYYRQTMYHPLLIFDGETGDPLVALLRPGTAPAGRGSLTLLQDLVRLLRVKLRLGVHSSSSAEVHRRFSAKVHSRVGMG
jgi:hypothetical protein